MNGRYAMHIPERNSSPLRKCSHSLTLSLSLSLPFLKSRRGHQDCKLKRASPAAISLHGPNEKRKLFVVPAHPGIRLLTEQSTGSFEQALFGRLQAKAARSLASIMIIIIIIIIKLRSCAARSKAAGLLAAICQRWRRRSGERTRLVGL
jgi:hypothetical protein